MMDRTQDMDSIIWKSTEFKLKFVIDNPNFKLPQVVRVVQGHMIDEDEALASGQILTLHSKRKIEKIIGQDDHGKEVSIPLSCQHKVKVTSLGKPQKFNDVTEVCCCDKPPTFIQNNEEIVSSDGEVIAAGTTLKIMEHFLSAGGDILGVTCNTEHNAEQVILPITLSSGFTETVAYDVETKRYLLPEVYKTFGLPIQVQFLPIADRNSGYGPQMGNLTLFQKVSQSSVIATSVIEGVRIAMSLPTDLPVTVQVPNKCRGVYYPPAQSSVDLSKFDYIDNNPYPRDTVKNQTYVEIKTPKPLPRHHSTGNIDLHKPKSTPKLNRKPPQEAMKRNKSTDLEKLVKSKFGFKTLKRSVSRLRDKSSNKGRDIEFDNQSTYTNMTSEDEHSINGACSIDVTSTSSESACNESFQHIVECIDGLTMNHHISTPVVDRHSRKSSGDSGIFLQRRKQQRLDSKSHPSSDCFSEWILPLKSSPLSKKRNARTSPYLWMSTDDKNNSKPTFDTNIEKGFRPKSTSETTSELTSKQMASMGQIQNLNEEGVSQVLDELRLSEFKEQFQRNQINGELLVCLEQDELVSELNLSLFQAKKLIMYVKGWRPEQEITQAVRTSRRNSLNPRDWSEGDVLLHMSSINLPDLGEFCRLNQVNGELLVDILDKATLTSIREHHGVKISTLDTKKLLNFVVKGWRPDSTPN